MKKEKFIQLYDYCQTLTIPISRRELTKKTVDIAAIGTVRVIWVSFDASDARGLFVSLKPDPSNQFYANAAAPNVILLSNELKANKCWERFINTKELMHFFDEDDEKTGSANNFQELLSDFENRAYQSAKQVQSDAAAVWMALACLCPESKRIEFKERRAKGVIDDYGIASQLRIPQSHVPKLLSEIFETKIKSLTSI